jgi:hypothetical protein
MSSAGNDAPHSAPTVAKGKNPQQQRAPVKIKRQPWTHEEDQVVLQLKEKDAAQWATMGFEDVRCGKLGGRGETRALSSASDSIWRKMTLVIPHRSPKQIKERYVNHLAPGLKKGNWSDEEIALLHMLHERHQHLPHK